MNRRGFLRLLATVPVAAAIGPSVLRPHNWRPDSYFCEDCHCSAEEVEDGKAPRWCEGPSFVSLLAPPCSLNEADIERICIEIQRIGIERLQVTEFHTSSLRYVSPTFEVLFRRAPGPMH